MRTTAEQLRAEVRELNILLDRPLEMFASKIGEPTRHSVGHLTLDKNSTGYQLEEQTSEHGGTRAWSMRLTPAKMAIMLQGIRYGRLLRDAHVLELIKRQKQSTHKLYQG